jgi:hypothetical protein
MVALRQMRHMWKRKVWRKLLRQESGKSAARLDERACQKLCRLHHDISICGGGRAFSRGGGAVDSPMARKKLSRASGVWARDKTPMSLRLCWAPQGQRKTSIAKMRRSSCDHSMRVVFGIDTSAVVRHCTFDKWALTESCIWRRGGSFTGHLNAHQPIFAAGMDRVHHQVCKNLLDL